jgi:hypothetical protein
MRAPTVTSRRSSRQRTQRAILSGIAAALFIAAPLAAQPDLRQMSGIPRPVDDLPNGSVSVRVIRGALTDNIKNQTVELHAGSQLLTAKTDAEGRAEFDKLAPGIVLKAVTVVDGARLESQEFPAPSQGGVRLLLVAMGDKGPSAEAPAPAPAPVAPAVAGQVVIGGQSRFIFQPAEESVDVFYLLDILNKSTAPVNPPEPFTFDMPTGATGTGIMEGSSPLASVSGVHVTVTGPFPPGTTEVQVGTTFTAASGSLDLVQRFPAALTDYSVFVKKVGDTALSSSQLGAQQIAAEQGETFLGANGTPVAAGQPLTISLTGMPHHSPAPHRTALTLAFGIVLAGVWAATRKQEESAARLNERKRLVTRRERLLGDLVRLERDQRDDRRRIHDDRYNARRAEIVVALEQVYGALASDDVAPKTGSGVGVPT